MRLLARAQLPEILLGLTMLKIAGKESLSEIDEALTNLRLASQDRYGNRIDWKKKIELNSQIDALLDLRLTIKEKTSQ